MSASQPNLKLMCFRVVLVDVTGRQLRQLDLVVGDYLLHELFVGLGRDAIRGFEELQRMRDRDLKNRLLADGEISLCRRD